MIRNFILAILIISSQFSYSQNIVENPSFETVNTGSLLCSWYTSQAQFASAITSWTVPTGGSTDIFHMSLATSCYCHPLSTHASSPGQQLPRTGNSMCNITVYGSGGCTPYREYLQGHLSTTLIPGQQYTVEFWVSFADNCTYATNNLGVYFSTTQVNVASMCVYNVTPQLNYTGAPITNMTGWELISFTYTATAAYNYFVLGNFYDDVSTTTVNMGGPKGTIRYFVDDVAIYPMSVTPTSDFIVTTPHCDGDASTVTYTGTATAGAIYNWNWDGGTATPGTGQGPHTVTWPGPGTYNITLSVTEGGQTSTVTTQSVVIYPVPTATFTAVSPVCENSNSTITYTGNAGSSATYIWDFDGGVIASGTGAGPYQVYWTTSGNYLVTLTVTENGCSSTYSVPVKVDPNPTSTFTLISPVCVGANTTITYTGSASSAANYNWNFDTGVINSGSGQGPYQVSWNTANTYNVTLTVDENGCFSTPTTVPITVTQIPTSTFSLTPILCFGDNSTITYTGNATSGATYTWDFNGGTIASGTGQGPYQINWATSGNYTISLEVTEGGCTSIITQDIVTNPTEVVATVTVDSVSCFSGSNGSVSVNATGGQTPYTYTWSNGTGSNFSAGNYTVTATDANGCTDVESFIIAQPTQLAWQTNQTNLSCYQDNSGMASITVNDGTPPYTYAWTGGGNTASINGLAIGTYIVTVTDANLCTITESIIISEPTQLTVTGTVNLNTTCFGNCDGSAIASAFGGTPTYSYLWSTGSATATDNSLCAGNSGITVTDNNGCTANTSVNISSPALLSVSIISSNDASCFGLCDGDATASATGGTLPYFYTWPSGGNNVSINNLCAGNYAVTVTDGNGCTATSNVTINEPSLVTATVTGQTDISCNGACDGGLYIQVAGGTPSYTYGWSNGQGMQNPIGLCAGLHSVIVTDQNGCTATASQTLIEPSALTVQLINSSDPTCFGNCDGLAEVNASGGTIPYSFLWNDGNNTALNQNICSGIYTATVTDGNSCTIDISVTLNEPSEIVVGAPGNSIICNGASEILVATATGGNPPYNFYWDDVLSNPVINISPTSFTIYSVYVTDINGCSSSNVATTEVSVTPAVELELLASSDSVCPGETVVISANISHGVSPYMLTNNLGDVVSLPLIVNPYNTTDYILSVVDQCGSTATEQILVVVYPLPSVNFQPSTTSGCVPLEVMFSNQYPNNSQMWNFGDNGGDNISFSENPTHTYTTAGVFDVSLIVTSQEGCTNQLVIPHMISVWPRPIAKFIVSPEVVSIIKPIVSFENLSIGADNYLWIFGDGDTSSIESPNHAYPVFPTGVYNAMLIALTNKGCPDTAYQEITVQDEYTFYAPTAFSPDFDSNNDVFKVYGNGIDHRNFKMYIYDRWGEVVFESTDINEGWNGRIKGGDIGKVGAYTWLVIYRSLNNVEHQETGVVTIIR